MASKEVARGGEILRQRVLPVGLAKLNDAVLVEQTSLPVGAQLFRASSAGTVYCSFDISGMSNLQGKSATEKFFKGGFGYRTFCFVDANLDGQFEGYFEKRSASGSLPVLFGRIPDHLRPISASYSVIDPSLSTYDANITIENGGKRGIARKRILFVLVGEGKLRATLTGEGKIVQDGPWPQSVSILGSQITILGAQEDGLTVRVNAMIPPKSFNGFMGRSR